MKVKQVHILVGNEVRPSIWEAEIPEGVPATVKGLVVSTQFEVCEHPGTKTVAREFIANLGEVTGSYTEEGARCPRCKGKYKDGKWQR